MTGHTMAEDDTHGQTGNKPKNGAWVMTKTDLAAAIPDLFTLSGSPYRGNAKMSGRPLRPEELFLVLDLDRPGLEEVKAAVTRDDREAAVEALLAYYRERREPGWFVSEQMARMERRAGAMPKLTASDSDRRVADDAERNRFHLLQFAAGYAPHDYGPEIDWDANPVNDIEWPCQMHRFAWSDAVTRCYSATDDERYARLWLRLVQDWIRKNPLTLERLSFPRSWDAIQVGIRVKAMALHLPRFLESPACSAEAMTEALASMYNQARRIEQMPYPNPDNFVQIETLGLACVAGQFPEFKESACWGTLAAERMWAAMQGQVLPDGVHGELAPGYHTMLAHHYLELAVHLGDDAIPEDMLCMTEQMVEVCLAISTPDGRILAVGDTHHGNSSKSFLVTAGRVLSRPDFLAVATEGQEGRWPERRNFAFKDGGFYIFRSGWKPDAVWLGLHCGPDSIEWQTGGFHSQFDRGTFELMAFGRKLMTDPGIYNYKGGDPDREAFRRTASHQCLTLNGANAARAGKCLQWIEDDGQGNAVLTVENASYPGLTHRRTVFFVQRRYFVWVDEALGTAEGNLDLHFQLTPGPAVIDPATKSARTDFPDGGNVLVWVDPEAPVTLEAEEAWYSPKWWKKEPLPAFRYRHNSRRAPARFVTAIVPYADGRPPPTVAIEHVEEAPGGLALTLTVSVDGGSQRLERRGK